MERPTTSGNRHRLGRPGLASLFIAGCLVAGCGAKQPAPEDFSATRRHFDYLLSQARQDAAAIRTEMANTRIAAAKQESEIKELRQQVADLRQALDARQAEIAALRSERDRMVQAKADLQTQIQTQVAELARLRATTNEVDTLRARMAELESQLVVARTTELGQVKKDLEQQVKPLQKGPKAPKAKKPEAASMAPAIRDAAPPNQKPNTPPKAVSPEPARAAQLDRRPTIPDQVPDQDGHLSDSRLDQGDPARLTVRPGDSLSMIARRYGVTVDQLKQANGLQRDQIEPGQLLVIPLIKTGP